MLNTLHSLIFTGMLIAQEGEPQASGGSLSFLLPLLLLFGLFYVFLILPQQRQEKKRREMLASLKRGDRVVTTGGIIGTIVKIDNNIVTLRVSQNTNIKIEKEAVRGVLTADNSEEKRDGRAAAQNHR